ncbi:hypothetical protein [Yinghuangia soli]|uniref:Uncharacterized protein n=1 Tax=Yinghuangia soli TaxID=2908204 RepID=A0AA41U471_9ACTN|nr:hypothetical protein [Yinghuangia soli]MCF2532546.1 hypothetical protein [Yinghuangia soli]
MHPWTAIGDSSRLSFWLRVREYAVPPTVIETATVRRQAGDWAGACAAAGIDIDLDLRLLARTHGGELAARVRSDLRHLAPDLLRWHMPRIAPDGLLRPGVTVPLARYAEPDPARRARAHGHGRDCACDRGRPRDRGRPVHLVVRTPPAWAAAGQRMSLALWDGSRDGGLIAAPRAHPQPRPHRRFRFDLHRHLWDARRTGELRVRSGAADRWPAEAAILLAAEEHPPGPVAVRVGARRRMVLDVRSAVLRPVVPADRAGLLPTLPDAASRVVPDLELLHAGLLDAAQLHPLVASALVPGYAAPAPPGDEGGGPQPGAGPRIVDCRGARHRIGFVDGALAALDHDPGELRREEMLVALTGTPLPCLQAIDAAHRNPECLTGVRERLDHGDITGALAVVESLLGPDAVLRDGPLRDVLEEALAGRIRYGMFRAGLGAARPNPAPDRANRRAARAHARRAGIG